MIPSQKTGIEIPIRARTVITRSDSLPAVTAEITPTNTPKPSQMIPAPIASENVAGMPWTICERTFCWFVYETSVLLKVDFIRCQYCT